MRIALIGSAFNRSDPTAVPPELRAVLDAETEVRVYLPQVSAFPRNALDLKIQEIGYIDAGLQALRHGCDAVVLNTVGDYGLAALRSATRLPVVGAGEVGAHQAMMLGRPFAVVTIWPRATDFLYRQLLADTALERHCVQVRHVGTEAELGAVGQSDDDYIARMHRGDRGVFDRVVAECRAAVREAGAASLLLGCTCMSPIAAEVASLLEVPVVNPLTAAARYAESLVRLRLAHSPASFAPATAARDAAFEGMAEVAAFQVAVEPCDACVFTPSN